MHACMLRTYYYLFIIDIIENEHMSDETNLRSYLVRRAGSSTRVLASKI